MNFVKKIWGNFFSLLKSCLKALKYHLFYVLVPSDFYTKFKFKKVFKYNLDFDSCVTFNERIQFRKIFDKNDLYTILTDKLLVRDYVSKLIGNKYLIQLFKATNNPDEINLDDINIPLIIKPNNSSGKAIIVMDKNKINIAQIRAKCREWLNYNFYFIWKEWQYKHIRPKIIIEKLILDKNKKVASDYKFHCFGGKVKFIQVDTDRFGDHKRTFLNKNWGLFNFSFSLVKNGLPIYKIDSTVVKVKPKKLNLMIRLAEKLSKDFDYVRVDLYNIDSKVYFGELTFTPDAGFGLFAPKKYDLIFGKEWGKAELIRLNKIPKVSVIMTLHNSEKFLDESITSILNQSLRNIELILINDASNDNSSKIMKKYAIMDNRIKIINNKTNLGPALSRNKGLEIALGKYVAVLDSDDIALQDRLKIQSDYLDTRKDIFLVGANADIIDENGVFLKRLKPICSQKELARILPKKNRLFHSSIMFRNKFIRYRDKFVYAQDYDFYLNLLYCDKKIVCLPDVLIKYRTNQNNITSKKYVKQMLFVEKAKEFYKQRVKNGYDRYADFNPNEILDINVEDNSNSNILKFKIKEKFKQGNYSEMRKLCNIYFKQNGYFDKDVVLCYVRNLI
ncbi:MAG: ATP-grasp fold amidoligase family protein [archaeon]|nr:ATP-grasp fold amidoligase family protein [archaeon]